MTDETVMNLAEKRKAYEIRRVEMMYDVGKTSNTLTAEYIENVYFTGVQRFNTYMDGLYDLFAEENDETIIDDLVGNIIEELERELKRIHKDAIEYWINN